MQQYAYHGKGGTIHSSVHFEWYKNDVNEKSRKVNGGEKRILTHEGYIFPLQFSQVLPYLLMLPCSSMECDTLPHVIPTSETDWYPIFIDSTEAKDGAWFDTVSDSSNIEYFGPFDMHGYYDQQTIVQDADIYYFYDNTNDE